MSDSIENVEEVEIKVEEVVPTEEAAPAVEETLPAVEETVIKEPAKEPLSFQLSIADPDVTSGTIAVSWCLNKEVLEELANEGVEDPQVVIIIAPEDKAYHMIKEVRYVVPLRDLMAYVEFRYPGKNSINSFVSFKPKKEAKSFYLSKEKGEYNTTVLGYDGQGWSHHFRRWDSDTHESVNSPNSASDTIHVDVPKECFAPEPSELEKVWVNHFFEGKSIDQCSFRRRRLFAYTVQPVLMFWLLVARLFMFVLACSILSKGTSLKYLLHPLDYKLNDNTDLFKGGPIVWSDKHEYYNPQPWKDVVSLLLNRWTTILLPIVFLPVLLAMHLFTVTSVLTTLFILLGMAIFVVGGALLIHTLVNADMKNPPKVVKDDLWYLQDDESEVLVCSTQKRPAKLSDLPAKHRTLKLRFFDLKTKVCRPFSG